MSLYSGRLDPTSHQIPFLFLHDPLHTQRSRRILKKLARQFDLIFSFCRNNKNNFSHQLWPRTNAQNQRIPSAHTQRTQLLRKFVEI